jgi:predicted transcriptional regulator
MPVSVSIRLPDKTAQALDELASATERSRTYLSIKALEASSRITRTTRSRWTV